MGKEGKDGKKKSKKERTRDEDETTASALRSVSVKVLREAPETSGCLLACFSDSPAPADLLDEGADPYKFQCRQMGKSGVRSLAGEKGRILLEGEQSQTKSCYRYLVGVYDPEKGRLEVVDPGSAGATGNIFALRRSLRGGITDGGVSKLSKDEAREALVDGFGSKRVKATHKKRKGQQLEEEGADAMESLEKTLRVRKNEADAANAAAGAGEEADDKHGSGQPNQLAPQPNLLATASAAIYTRHALLNDECWDAINPGSFIHLSENSSKDRSTLPNFVARNLSHIAAAGEDKKSKKYVAKLLTLATYLMRFHGLSNRFKHTPETLKNEMGIPLPLGVHFLQVFAEGGDPSNSYTKPNVHKDRLLLLLAVTSLMACSLDVEIDDMGLDLKMHTDKLAAYFKEVGAKVIKTTKKVKTEGGGGLTISNYRCTLSLPVTFPKQSRGIGGSR